MRLKMDLTRRSLLGRIGVAAGVCATSSFAALAMHGGAGGMKKIDAQLGVAEFQSRRGHGVDLPPGEAPILDGRATGVWRYSANLLKGPENTLTTLPDSYLGPLMRFQKGQKIRIRLRNGLPEPTITHWHGLHVPMLMDGHPMYAIDPGETFVYEFEMRNRAGLYFYHPHPHEATATQVYRGLAGAIIVGDDEEKALELPSGEFEIPIVLQDRSFNDDNQLVYGGGMHAQMVGFQGDRCARQRKARLRHRRGEPRLSAADFERLEFAHLQARLGRRLADHGHRRRRRPAGEAGREALRHARARRTARCVGRFQRAKRRFADRHAQRAVFRRIAEDGAGHDGRHDGGNGAAGRRRLSAVYGPRRARGGREPGLAASV